MPPSTPEGRAEVKAGRGIGKCLREGSYSLSLNLQRGDLFRPIQEQNRCRVSERKRVGREKRKERAHTMGLN